MKERVSQKDIARELGVDVSTVSLALRGHPRISEATIRRVREAAERLGYRPDPALASIAASRWQGRRSVSGVMLAFLVDSRKDEEVELKLYERGIRRQADLLGYGVTTFYWDEFPSAAAFWRVVQSRGIRGVLVGQSRAVLDEDLFNEQVAPVVHCGFLREVEGEMVRPDLRLAVKETCRRLLQKFNRVTCFLPIERELVSDHTILGAAYVAESVPEVGDISLVVASQRPNAADLARLKKTAPEAIITINERQADYLRRHWPRAMTLPIYTLHTLPPFDGKRGMDLRLEAIGSVAVNLLEMKMRRLPLSTASFRQTLLIEPRWLSEG
ncbi:LacI family DNA-binding transcriptional regulator [Coraliomargarita parva]|uniref:LacI family DNA-binding transcriptional regulator n=1 Tax=Coraliomargarita parva TaxID=3014050 RepID=UPI0022B4CE29|nr:LacI family DNA-binding transcriptional regulator [Coraliomargarita parva]